MEELIKDLTMGDKLVAKGDTITVGPAVISFGRKVTVKDLEAIYVVYTMGAAARTRLISKAWDTFFRSFQPVEIIGYTEDADETAGD